MNYLKIRRKTNFLTSYSFQCFVLFALLLQLCSCEKDHFIPQDSNNLSSASIHSDQLVSGNNQGLYASISSLQTVGQKGGVLTFTSLDHFEKVIEDLEHLSSSWSSDITIEDLIKMEAYNGIDEALDHFENDKGFNSLRKQINREMNDYLKRGEVGVNPDDHFIPFDAMRAVLTQDAGVVIGSDYYQYLEDGLVVKALNNNQASRMALKTLGKDALLSTDISKDAVNNLEVFYARDRAVQKTFESRKQLNAELLKAPACGIAVAAGADDENFMTVNLFFAFSISCDMNFTVNYGDGQMETVNFSENIFNNGTGSKMVSHTYATPGDFIITINGFETACCQGFSINTTAIPFTASPGCVCVDHNFTTSWSTFTNSALDDIRMRAKMYSTDGLINRFGSRTKLQRRRLGVWVARNADHITAAVQSGAVSVSTTTRLRDFECSTMTSLSCSNTEQDDNRSSCQIDFGAVWKAAPVEFLTYHQAWVGEHDITGYLTQTPTCIGLSSDGGSGTSVGSGSIGGSGSGGGSGTDGAPGGQECDTNANCPPGTCCMDGICKSC